ncbi:syntaxin-81-like isoform X1 [Mangifera indica]|uniref:syntaxin-81-like isoform X1 n=1 Tax=Mangifera indica TaxID=29780 RepID=UPI001CFA2F47|nr:syntaxin-81-like isoform X1 [Mangifera indica]XP_044480177.1 syntaxin-81-like isoform X1 [Mangifera indica]XP_044480178.1 syntaxin-81-like isoform X1 [Mangifera indica]XP_044480179.1 syntaxin-81-like isoform X1 [Mangifera indica]
MARVRDRTEDFKDAVRHTAVSLGYDESKLAVIMASFIIHKPRQRSSFTKAALKTLESIGALEKFMLKHQKDYVDLHRTTEQERDSIEHEVSYGVFRMLIQAFDSSSLMLICHSICLQNCMLSRNVCFLLKTTIFKFIQVIAFIKACKEQIDILKNSINDDEANSKGWLGLRAHNSNADTVAHKHGVVLILSEKLHLVTAQFDHLRAVRFQDAINRAAPRRKFKRVAESNASDTSKSNILEIREPDGPQPESLSVQQQLLDDETRALQVELSSLLDAVQQTETKMVEMSALNHLMSTHVLQQAQQIEVLYDQAVEATKNVELGNKELSQAIQRNSSSRTFLLLFLFVLTFSILFLDWYN